MHRRSLETGGQYICMLFHTANGLSNVQPMPMAGILPEFPAAFTLVCQKEAQVGSHAWLRTVKESAFGSLALLSNHSTSTCIHSAVALRAKRESYFLQIACVLQHIQQGC